MGLSGMGLCNHYQPARAAHNAYRPTLAFSTRRRRLDEDVDGQIYGRGGATHCRSHGAGPVVVLMRPAGWNVMRRWRNTMRTRSAVIGAAQRPGFLRRRNPARNAMRLTVREILAYE